MNNVSEELNLFGSFLIFFIVGEEMTNQLNLTPYEIENIFSVLVDESTNKITADYLSKLLAQLEQVKIQK